MFHKNIIFIIFIISIIILSYSLFFKKIESFKNDSYVGDRYGEYNFLVDNPSTINQKPYKKMNITLTKEMVNLLNMYINKNSIDQLELVKKLKYTFPFHFNINNQEWYETLDIINKKKNILYFINEQLFLDYILTQKVKNICFIGAFYFQYMFLIVPNNSDIYTWKDLKSKKIITNNEESLYLLKELLYLSDYKNKEVEILIAQDFRIITQYFSEQKVDAIFLNASHPSNYMVKLATIRDIKVITTEGLSQDKINYNFPVTYKRSLDFAMFNIKSRPLIKECYASRVLLVTNKNTNYIYNFIKNVFNNFQYIKGKNLIELTNYFMTYCPIFFNIHKGSLKFFIEKNFITEEKNNLCYYYWGGQKCNNDLVNKNRFIENSGNIFKGLNVEYDINYTTLNPENKWNNRVGDFNYKTNGKRFIDSQEYINRVPTPDLITKIDNDSVQVFNNSSKIYKNYIKQLKYNPNDLLPFR